jgi:hypothetical protein
VLGSRIKNSRRASSGFRAIKFEARSKSENPSWSSSHSHAQQYRVSSECYSSAFIFFLSHSSRHVMFCRRRCDRIIILSPFSDTPFFYRDAPYPRIILGRVDTHLRANTARKGCTVTAPVAAARGRHVSCATRSRCEDRARLVPPNWQETFIVRWDACFVELSHGVFVAGRRSANAETRM